MLDFKKYVIDETTILSTVSCCAEHGGAHTSFMETKHTWNGFMGKSYTEKEALKAIERMAAFDENDVRVIDYPTFKMLVRKKEGSLSDYVDDYDIITTILNIRKV